MTRIDKIFKITAYLKYLEFMGLLIWNKYNKVLDKGYNNISIRETIWYYSIVYNSEYDSDSDKYKEYDESFVEFWETKMCIFIGHNYIKICNEDELSEAIEYMEREYKNILPKGNKLIEQMLKIMILIK